MPPDPVPPDPTARARLLESRRTVTDRITALDGEFAALVDAGTGTNLDDEHDPEGATIAFERAQVSALLDAARERLAEIDRALEEVEQNVYGICEVCGEPIAAGRLQARPSARTCIRCASR